jgi:hypothetical protein
VLAARGPLRALPAETAIRSTATQIYEGTNQIQRMVMAASCSSVQITRYLQLLWPASRKVGRQLTGLSARSHVRSTRLMPIISDCSAPADRVGVAVDVANNLVAEPD